jgi:electron transport complex protein RnfD
MEPSLKVSQSPHLRDTLTAQGMMWAAVLALAPAAAGGFYFFGTRAVALVAISVLSAVVVEASLQAATGRKVTVADGSAVVTGILLAFNLPPGVPYWLPMVGSAFAVAVAKMPFGGLGYNLFNPALAARAFLVASWPVHMTSAWIAPARGSLSGTAGISAVTEATPLGVFRMARGVLGDPASSAGDLAAAAENLRYLSSSDSLKNLFLGNVGGCIGETSVLLLAIGAMYLLARRVISWRIPFCYLATVAVLTWALGGQGAFRGSPVFHLLAGGLMLGACFMATDPVTSPVTPRGRMVFGIGCGILTSMIRLKGGYPEGVSYSILIMNMTVPLIDRLTRPRILGEARRG